MKSSIQIKLEPIEIPAPRQAGLLRVRQFPLAGEEMDAICLMLRFLGEVAVQEYKLHHEILLQLWSLSPQTGGDILSANVTEWSPKFGLGVWPNRKPPQAWTEEMLVDAAAAALRGQEPERPSNRLLRLTAAESQRTDAAAKMRGFGAQIEIFAKDSIELIEERARDLFLPTIVESRFQNEPFYLPLLDGASLSNSGAASQLQAWLCGIDLYIRESAEDRGILLISSLPLEPLLNQAQAWLDASSPLP